MEWLAVTIQIYRKAFVRGAVLALKNWPVFASLLAYSAILTVAGGFAVALGMLGGFLAGFVSAACAGSFLYLVEQIVRSSKVSLDDFRRSFGMYMWDIIGVSFVLWIFRMVITPFVFSAPESGVIFLCVEIAVLVFLNAVPELIYFGHYSSMEIITESYKFIADNWIEWFPANIVLTVLAFAIYLAPLPDSLHFLKLALLCLFLYYMFIVRGLIFIELFGSNRRGRAFRYRAGQ